MNTKIKVAAYCRVSTDFQDQLNSLSVQIAYFTEYISSQEKQTAFYDSEIARLTEEITQLQNAAENQRNQLSEIEKAIEYIGKLSATDTDGDNTELYRSMINKVVVPEYPVLQIYLNGVPFAYHVVYTVKKAPCLGIYDIIIDTCEVVA